MLKTLGSLTCALVMSAALLPAAAHADDPHDPSMRSPAARARDRAIIRRMNQDQLAYVRKRDAGRMQAFHDARAGRDARYADARADYQRKMAEWRHAVAACRAGRWEYCDR
ncbi:hypothetical protein SCH01S_32_00300 [Sphingomonas changbaiensis NBRC 104936]|uniref:Lysozyme inhibitor LprI N-terminal domain-containing protein n=1 Tax=Sphingomonas changbaiensis NBRC 104936 TaxID=1219043 RepID=A0A0E9MPS6_9SPHN|nr:hypothetical protein [Sphingomonas changbaiensis]GAO39493.1 hypothetical protein SCH01S_32_00300 [Sphingomonas changbaiensis NBRC 104936]